MSRSARYCQSILHTYAGAHLLLFVLLCVLLTRLRAFVWKVASYDSSAAASGALLLLVLCPTHSFWSLVCSLCSAGPLPSCSLATWLVRYHHHVQTPRPDLLLLHSMLSQLFIVSPSASSSDHVNARWSRGCESNLLAPFAASIANRKAGERNAASRTAQRVLSRDHSCARFDVQMFVRVRSLCSADEPA